MPYPERTRAVLQVFEKYQKDRVTFVQTIAELATRPQVRIPPGDTPTVSYDKPRSTPAQGFAAEWRHGVVVGQNIEVLQQAGVMSLLRPLLLDNVPRCVRRPGAPGSPACLFRANGDGARGVQADRLRLLPVTRTSQPSPRTRGSPYECPAGVNQRDIPVWGVDVPSHACVRRGDQAHSPELALTQSIQLRRGLKGVLGVGPEQHPTVCGIGAGAIGQLQRRAGRGGS